MKRALLLALCVVGLSSCEWMKGRSTKDNLDPPATLTEFSKSAPVRKMWSQDVGDGSGRSGTRPRPVEAEGVVYASDLEGTIVATARPFIVAE